MKQKIAIIIFIILLTGTLFIFKQMAFYRSSESNPETSSNTEITLPTQTSPRVTFIDPVRGARNASVTIVEFSDYYCLFCQQLEPILKQIVNTYSNQVRLVWKDMPNTGLHPKSFEGAEAARCAGEQGKFWQYHDLLYERTTNNSTFEFETLATNLDLNITSFRACLDSHTTKPKINANILEGSALRIPGTPYIYINGQAFEGSTFEDFKAVIEALLQQY